MLCIKYYTDINTLNAVNSNVTKQLSSQKYLSLSIIDVIIII